MIEAILKIFCISFPLQEEIIGQNSLSLAISAIVIRVNIVPLLCDGVIRVCSYVNSLSLNVKCPQTAEYFVFFYNLSPLSHVSSPCTATTVLAPGSLYPPHTPSYFTSNLLCLGVKSHRLLEVQLKQEQIAVSADQMIPKKFSLRALVCTLSDTRLLRSVSA